MFRDGRKSSFTSGTVFIVLVTVSVGFRILGDRQLGKEPEKRPTALNESLCNAVADTSSLHGLDSMMTAFLKAWGMHGASLSIMRNDSLVYAKGYGEADNDTPMETYTLLRVASVSKLITAAGIMKLQELDSLTLDDTVFREGDALSDLSGSIKDKRCYNITIRQLLTHSAGFTTRYTGLDPLFSTCHMMTTHHLDTAPRGEELARLCLGMRLGYTPGTSSEYSNLGYLLLSLIIEKKTGMDYEEWMQKNILEPAGCHDFHIGQNFYEEKEPSETRYYEYKGREKEQSFESWRGLVDTSYGADDINALSGAGAWICSTPELMRFVASIDGRPEVSDILSAESIAQMTAVTDSVTYGLGWMDISKDSVWTRTGTLCCTKAMVTYFTCDCNDSQCWILVTNTGAYYSRGYKNRVLELFRKCKERYSPLLPRRDFFYTTYQNQELFSLQRIDFPLTPTIR